MATIQDIFDWLNQGAQGDIPGTGGEQPNAPQASQGAGVPQAQPIGDVVPFGNDQTQYQRPSQPWPQNAPQPWDMYSGQRGGPPVDYSYPPAKPMLPANEASAEGQKGAQAGKAAGTGIAHLLFGKQQQSTPQDYSGDIPPTLLGHYNALVQSGLPPDVAHSILTQPSMGEGEDTLATALHTWPYPYAGSQQEYQSAQQSPPSYSWLWDQLMTPPTYEDQ